MVRLTLLARLTYARLVFALEGGLGFVVAERARCSAGTTSAQHLGLLARVDEVAAVEIAVALCAVQRRLVARRFVDTFQLACVLRRAVDVVAVGAAVQALHLAWHALGANGVAAAVGELLALDDAHAFDAFAALRGTARFGWRGVRETTVVVQHVATGCCTAARSAAATGQPLDVADPNREIASDHQEHCYEDRSVPRDRIIAAA